MILTSSIVVARNLDDVWLFLADLRNAPKWDRSIARATLMSNGMAIAHEPGRRTRTANRNGEPERRTGTANRNGEPETARLNRTRRSSE